MTDLFMIFNPDEFLLEDMENNDYEFNNSEFNENDYYSISELHSMNIENNY